MADAGTQPFPFFRQIAAGQPGKKIKLCFIFRFVFVYL